MNKKVLMTCIAILLVLVLVSNVLAITGALGNGRMILRGDAGEKIEGYVLVKNTNNISTAIVVSPGGDLKDSIKVIDKNNNNFTLAPGEERKVEFTITASEAGTTESKLNVQFTGVGEKDGVGLSSVITLIAKGASSSSNEDNSDASSSSSSTQGASTSITGKISVMGENNEYILPLASTGILLIAFIVLMIIYYVRRNRMKKIGEKREDEERGKIKESVGKTKKGKTKPKKRAKKLE